MSERCPPCCGPKRADYRCCWRCHVDDIKAAAWAEGYAAGRSEAQQKPPLDLCRWRQLAQLVHPDRHGNSKTATEVTVWLNSLRGRLQ
jgi:hypothetical protein